jgi:hypothetical protein
MHLNWTQHALTTNETRLSINDQLTDLFIREWETKINYESYFNKCNPTFCTHTSADQADFSHAVILFISLYGGLVILLRWITPLLIQVVLNCKYHSANTTGRLGMS